ncbi:MAG: beta-N-acetylhexosaminidase [Clostridia bacterium]|nr:beta-N-acetylhexosaminidase [Clostridia bacterium]
MRKKILSMVLTLCLCVSLVTPVYAVDTRVNQIVKGMSLQDKITQTLMIDFRTWGGEDMTVLKKDVKNALAKYRFGAVILFANNIKTTEDTVKLTKAMQKANTGLPLLIATDQEGGLVYRLGSGTALPGNMALAATGDVANATKCGEIIGAELAACGINTDLAPVLDVNNNAGNPVIGIRSFSDLPETVSSYGNALISGINEYGVIACGKHFPGHGDTDVDSHYGLPVVKKSLAKLKKNELVPFQSAIDNGIDMIMTAHILYPNVDNTTIHSDKTGKDEKRPATMSKKIITDLLKGDMGFKGVVVTDGMNMQGIADTYDEVQACVEALAAGVDMICMPATGLNKKADLKRIDKIIAGVKKAVKKGYISEERLNDAVTRIVTLKEKRGILDYDQASITVENATSVVGCKANRNAERKIAAKAVTVVKNKDKVLPLKLKKSSKVLMLSPYSNETAQGILAWNRGKKAGSVPDGAKVKTFCYNGISKVTGDLKKAVDWANIVIVTSEVSSKTAMSYGNWFSLLPRNVVNYCKKNDKVSVVMSVDNPYDLQLYTNANAKVGVYGCKGSTLDPTEALTGKVVSPKKAFGPNIVAGVEVILGTYGATGKLPVNIPKFDKENLKYTKEIYYKRGRGLTYKKK